MKKNEQQIIILMDLIRVASPVIAVRRRRRRCQVHKLATEMEVVYVHLAYIFSACKQHRNRKSFVFK